MLMNRLRREQGFSMIVVMVAMLIGSLLALAALSAANGDFPSARENQDRKAAYAAAESGLAYFNFKLNQSNVYWKTCGDSNSGRVPQTGSKAVPGATSQNYVIEFLPANGAPKCDSASPDATMIDRATATFRIRVTGRSGSVYRSVVATYKRKSFLDYLWFTTSEAGDPAIFSGTTTECLKPRSQRSGCTEIQFISADELKGPMHTDDTFLVCDDPLFGRDPSQYTFPVNDAIEAGGPSPGYEQNGWGCSGQPRVHGTFSTGVASMPMPSTNSGLATVATANGWTFTGRIRIRLNGASMDVWQQDSSGADSPSTPIKSGWPTNGVIYVNSGTCSTNPSPVNTNYTEAPGCANAYVSGSYSRDLTIASANDIIVGPNKTINGSLNDGNIYNTGNSALGLIANRYVRVWHPVSDPDGNGCYDNVTPVQTNVRIDAAIMSVQHSFIVDNYDKGPQLGDLTVNGAIAQKFRGTVGKQGGCTDHGYFKDYNYDDRFHYLNPPSFLDPVTESWSVKRRNEQVPAAKPTGL
jgi:type II secretory pathway pseudopilin PulG